MVSVVGKQIFVEGLVVAGNTSSDACCMGCKYGCNRWKVLSYVQQAQSGHPFVTMIHHFFVIFHLVTAETLYHFGRSIREHRRLVVISIAVQTVHLEVFPQLRIYFIFLRKEGLKIYQHSNRRARNIPTAHLNVQAIRPSLLYPIGIKAIHFLKTCVLSIQERPYEDYPVGHCRL